MPQMAGELSSASVSLALFSFPVVSFFLSLSVSLSLSISLREGPELGEWAFSRVGRENAFYSFTM